MKQMVASEAMAGQGWAAHYREQARGARKAAQLLASLTSQQSAARAWQDIAEVYEELAEESACRDSNPEPAA